MLATLLCGHFWGAVVTATIGLLAGGSWAALELRRRGARRRLRGGRPISWSDAPDLMLRHRERFEAIATVRQVCPECSTTLPQGPERAHLAPCGAPCYFAIRTTPLYRRTERSAMHIAPQAVDFDPKLDQGRCPRGCFTRRTA